MSEGDIITQIAGLKTKINECSTNNVLDYLIAGNYITEDKRQELYVPILSTISLGKPVTNMISSVRKNRRKKKDPNAPKRPPHAYLLFKSAKKQEIKDTLADEGEEITFGSMSSRAGAMWKAMSAKDKKPYEDTYKANNIIYQEALASYKASNPVQEAENVVVKPTRKRSKSKKSILEDCPTSIPEEFAGEWLGPYEDTFIRGSIKNIIFTTLNEAIVAANERDDCAGITRSNRGYLIRMGYKDPRPSVQGTGPEGLDDLIYPSPNGETSFLKKSAVDNYNINGPDEKLCSNSKKNKSKVKKKSKLHIEILEPKKKNIKRKNKHTIKIQEQLQNESDTDDASESSSKIDTIQTTEEVSVKKVTIDGTEYFIDGENKIYDNETQDFVGKLENGNINFDAVDSDEDDFSD